MKASGTLIRRRAVYAAAMLLCGCSPAFWQKQSDDVALRNVQRAQAAALGRPGQFSISPAEEALRRRLLEVQGLPYAGQASLGSDALAAVPYWPEQARRAASQPTSQPTTLPGSEVLRLSLADSLQIAARNNRDYQTQKESVFETALALDLSEQEFRDTFTGALEGLYSEDLSDGRTAGVSGAADGTWSRKFSSGAKLTAGIAVDLVKLLTMDRTSSFGVLADASVSVPLLRGSGRHIVTEPLMQAQRDIIYAIYTMERTKRKLAVSVASSYLGVLQKLDTVANADDNYRSLVLSARRSRAMADAGRLEELQVDQARQNELAARSSWISAQQSYANALDSFKVVLGLPADARIELDRAELTNLSQASAVEAMLGAQTSQPTTVPASQPAFDPTSYPASDPMDKMAIVLDQPSQKGAGPLEMDPDLAVQIAMEKRLDLRKTMCEVVDAQRKVVVAADALGAELTLSGDASMGESRSISSAGSANAHLRPEKGSYSVGMLLNLPFERTAERNAYRASLITLEQSVRDVQSLEDDIKLSVRSSLRKLLQAREGIIIQAQALQLATKRVQSTTLLLKAGRAETRDVLEAQEALVAAQDDLTQAKVDYRVAELELQRDMDVLEVDEKGLWHEYRPENDKNK